LGINFKETSINKMDKKKYDENFAQIDWGKKKECECSEDQVCDLCQERTYQFKPDGKTLDID
jgi:hypothetical protein